MLTDFDDESVSVSSPRLNYYVHHLHSVSISQFPQQEDPVGLRIGPWTNPLTHITVGSSMRKTLCYIMLSARSPRGHGMCTK